MKFSYLEDIHKQWHDVLVISRTIEHDDKKYHIIGMTAGDNVKLHIIEPYTETENYFSGTKGVRSQRKILRKQRERMAAVPPDTSKIPAELFLIP